MRRKFAEIDDNGVVVEIHDAEVKGNKGKDAKEPKAKINTRNKVVPNGHVNKGDRWSDKHQCFLRPLVKSDELRQSMREKMDRKRSRELSRAEEKNVKVKKHA